MRHFLLVLLYTPLLSVAQKPVPRYENDTLYTSSGYKIYKGQTLLFGNPTGNRGNFRYINIKSETRTASLANNTIVIKKLKNFGISVLGNAYIEIIGSIKFKDGSKGSVDLHIAFDRAIENLLSLPSEIIVPDEYRNRPTASVADELKKLNELFTDGIITKEEYEAQKKKLLDKL
jgi:hypothetical protein